MSQTRTKAKKSSIISDCKSFNARLHSNHSTGILSPFYYRIVQPIAMLSQTVFVLGLLASIVTHCAGNPVPTETHQFVRRDPSDTSGKSRMDFDCGTETIPIPGGPEGEGEGGFSQFNEYLAYLNDAGTSVPPNSCANEGKSSFCFRCAFDIGPQKVNTTVEACWNPIAGASGCSIEFTYKGYTYNSQTKEPKCGHTNKLEAFSSDLQAICYFDG